MTNVIVGFFNALKGFFNTVIPSMNGDFTGNVASGITWMANLINASDFLIPVSDIFAILIIVVGIKLFIFGVFCVNWVLRFIP